jgi:hypothetical protein
MGIKAAGMMLTLFVALGAAGVSAETSSSGAMPLRSALVRAKQITDAPILFPTSLPAFMEDDSAMVSFVDGDKDSYDISLYQRGNDGEATIFVGEFTGRSHLEGGRIGKPVRLINHITGYFRPRSCGGSCAPSSIEWSVKGIHYEIQLRFGFDSDRAEQKIMVDAANSAIEAGSK